MSGRGRQRPAPRRGVLPGGFVKITAALTLAAAFACAGAYAWLASAEGKPAAPHPYFANERAGAQVIAHRGGAGLWPENTLYAFGRALALGADVVEADVRLTADGEFVLMHDATVGRTTDGAGEVARLTLAELKRLDAGYRWTDDGGRTFKYRGLRIGVPTLGEALDEFPGARFVIEPKTDAPAAGERLCRLVRERGAAARVIVASFRRGTLAEFRRACPEAATSASSPEALRFFAMQRLGVAAAASPAMQALQVPEYFAGLTVPTPSFLRDARERNLRVHVWTVNDPADMRRLAAAGVDGIMTDYPDRLLEVLGRAGPPAP